MYIVFVNWKLAKNANLNLFSLFGMTTQKHPLYSSARVSS